MLREIGLAGDHDPRRGPTGGAPIDLPFQPRHGGKDIVVADRRTGQAGAHRGFEIVTQVEALHDRP